MRASTSPPVPSAFPTVNVPSASISTIGNPTAWRSGTSLKPGSAKYPPVTCAPHSIRCPAMVARPSTSQSVSVHPKWAIAGPTARDGSATRPVITTCAPARRAAAMAAAPR